MGCSGTLFETLLGTNLFQADFGLTSNVASMLTEVFEVVGVYLLIWCDFPEELGQKSSSTMALNPSDNKFSNYRFSLILVASQHLQGMIYGYIHGQRRKM